MRYNSICVLGNSESLHSQPIVWRQTFRSEIDKLGKSQVMKGLECHGKEQNIRLVGLKRYREPLLECYFYSHLKRRPWAGREPREVLINPK